PAYQRNDYIGWINRAKTPAMRIERLEQMLTELAQGGIYMGKEHKASRK
ncbi:MAG: YdeI/OmpD-associated family protein, partial [Rothia dentocariosa]